MYAEVDISFVSESQSKYKASTYKSASLEMTYGLKIHFGLEIINFDWSQTWNVESTLPIIHLGSKMLTSKDHLQQVLFSNVKKVVCRYRQQLTEWISLSLSCLTPFLKRTLTYLLISNKPSSGSVTRTRTFSCKKVTTKMKFTVFHITWLELRS